MAILSGKNDVTFKSAGFNLAGHLYTPEGFSEAGSCPAIIYSPPFNQIKEMAGSHYGRHLAERGYVVLVFDHIGYGESEGDIKYFENGYTKVQTIWDAVSYMGTLPFVDRENMFGLGVCASGGYMALAAVTDKRIKAIASVVGMLSNKSSFFDTMDRDTIMGLLSMQNAAQQKAYETGEVDYVDGLGYEGVDPSTLEPGTARAEGFDYYMTPRAGKETYPRFSYMSPAFMIMSQMLTDALAYAPVLYTPFIGITGTNAMSPGDTGPLTKSFYEQASEPKEMKLIEGATHVSLYDNQDHIAQAVEAMDAFFKKHGGAAAA
jgi:fermentation-respiration switch protein FrsA (DUF1100 family)